MDIDAQKEAYDDQLIDDMGRPQTAQCDYCDEWFYEEDGVESYEWPAYLFCSEECRNAYDEENELVAT